MGQKLSRLILAAMLFCAPAQAAELPSSGWMHAIAMHGQPALSAKADHLPYANPNAFKGGALVQSEVGTFDTLNPYTLKGKALSTPDLVFDRLTARSWNEPFTLYGLIAKEIWLAPDRKRIIFRLDPRARFNDGSAITAEDVAFSFETLKTQGRPNMRRVYGLVSQVERYDDRTIGFSLKPEADRETPLILAMMPVLSKAYWQGKTFDSTTLKPLLASGPYTITNVDPGRSITLQKTKNYWARDHVMREHLYNPERWIVRYFRDATVALEAFKKGDVSFRVENDPARWARAYDERGFVKKEIEHNRPDRVRAIIFNMRKKPFNDIKVREALRLSFDQDWLVKTQGYGAYRPTTSLFPNSDLAAKDKKLPNARDALKRADALLTQAGFVVKNGRRTLNLTLILNEARDEKIALAWKASLKRLGVDLKIRTLDVVQFTGAITQFDYDMVLHGWSNSLSPGSEQSVYWSCQAAETPGSFNYAGLCDKKVEQALKDLVAAKDRDALRKATKALDERIWALSPAILLPHMERDFLAYWPQKTAPGPQNALYGFVLESLSAVK